MSLLARLGLAHRDAPPPSPMVAAIKEQLNRLPGRRAELVAAFAGLLVRVARADNEISDAERRVLRDVVAANVGLTPEESTAVADIVVHQTSVLAGIDYAELARTFNEIGTREDKARLIDCLYAIATADNVVTVVEDDEIRQVSQALLLTHPEFISIRSRYKQQLEILQSLRQRQ